MAPTSPPSGEVSSSPDGGQVSQRSSDRQIVPAGPRSRIIRATYVRNRLATKLRPRPETGALVGPRAGESLSNLGRGLGSEPRPIQQGAASTMLPSQVRVEGDLLEPRVRFPVPGKGPVDVLLPEPAKPQDLL